jgi:hypothetical protein
MTLADVWSNPAKPWPSIVYVETTNLCNYKCLCCGNENMRRHKGIMTVEQFKIVADKVKARGVQIGAMYCSGEPLMDPTLFDKYAYGNEIGVLQTDIVGLNSNVSLLTEEKWEPLLRHTPNIIMSFFNTEDEYERITGRSWAVAYANATGFIRYRDARRPDFRVFIGCNKIDGHSLERVQTAFAGYRVEYQQDCAIHWNMLESGLPLTGPLGRLGMFPFWKCDGHKGALQIRNDGACCYCAYDFYGLPDGTHETHIGNFFTDTWEQLEAAFRAKWQTPSTLCARCDYWQGAKP